MSGLRAIRNQLELIRDGHNISVTIQSDEASLKITNKKAVREIISNLLEKL